MTVHLLHFNMLKTLSVHAVFFGVAQASVPVSTAIPWVWHDKVLWGASLLLALIGISGVIAAVRTLRYIKSQTEISHKALISQFRPMMRVRGIQLRETDESLSIEITVVNKGGTSAHIHKGSVKLSWKYSHTPESPEISTTTFQPFSLLPGEDAPLKISMNESWIVFRISVNEVLDGRIQSMFIRCEGKIWYSDDNGTKRQTAFRRLYDHSTERFIADSDPEYEYAD